MARSKYLLHIKSGRGGKRKQFNKPQQTNRVWLRSRRCVRKELLGRGK